MKKYGSFNDKNEFVIDNPKTPEPWIHYCIRPDQPGTSTFCSGITNACGGFDVRGTHENTFVDTRVHLNDDDSLVRCVYIKDVASGEIWSSSWQPCRKEGQEFKTIFRFGSASYESLYNGIRTETVFFVPKEFDGWIKSIRISNESKTERKLELYPFVPVHLGDALVRLLAGDNDAFFGGAAWDSELNGILFRRHHGIAADDDAERINGMLGNVALFYSTLNEGQTEYAASLEDFYGDRFHGPANPLAVLEGRMASRPGIHLRRACGAFKNTVPLKPGESLEFAIALVGTKTSNYYLDGKSQLKEALALVKSKEKRDAMLETVHKIWKARMEKLSLESPEASVNRAFPWLQYQCEAVLTLNRMKSRFHTGYEYGWGFRDILQDILFLLPYRIDEMRERILFIAPQIFSEGYTYHNFFLDQRGNRAVEASDDPLWFVQAVVRYCRESGDYGLLDEMAAYADGKEGMPHREGSILEHCRVCIEHVIDGRSPRGIPYMKDCDWNDDLNEARVDGKPSRRLESVMVAMQLRFACTEFAALLEASAKGSDTEIERYRKLAAETDKAIREHCTDPKGWYKRALDVSGKLTDPGSSASKEARIFLEPQVFAVTCALETGPDADRLLDIAMQELDTQWGAVLCWPYYRGLSDRNELPERSWNIEKEPAGMKENGGIFMHLNAWLVEAWCKAGNGSRAFDVYNKTLPEHLSSDQDRYRCEPYVYPEYVRGKGAQEEGRGGHTWLTGTAPTMHTAITEWIFGIRPDWDGLIVDPCVPGSWKNFSATRSYRGTRWEISFENPEGVEKGVREVHIDGQKIPGLILPNLADGKTHRARVIMGKTD